MDMHQEADFESQTPAILIKLGSLIDPDAKRNLYWPLILYIVNFVQEVSAAKNSLESRQCRLLVTA